MMIDDITSEQLEFATFCIENLALHLGITGQEAYDLLAVKSNALQGYILPYYNALHTQGKEYIIEDILEYMKTQGVTI